MYVQKAFEVVTDNNAMTPAAIMGSKLIMGIHEISDILNAISISFCATIVSGIFKLI